MGRAAFLTRKLGLWRAIQAFIMDDVYKPHAHEEIAELVAPEVAATLDPHKKYGI